MIRFKKLPEDIEDRIESLRDILDQNPHVVFAYLFGGFAKKKTSSLSDVDIAVYVKDVKKFDYLKFYSEVTDFLGTDEVDIVVLNNAPLSLAGRILHSKRILVDKDPFLRHNFESLTIRKFLDFQYIEKSYFRQRYKLG